MPAGSATSDDDDAQPILETMTTTSPEQLVCACGTGPNVARCQAGHLEPTNAKKGNRTRCPHRVDGVRCAKLSTSLSDRQVSQILGPPQPAPGEPGAWDGQTAAIRGLVLGPELPDADRCTECECSSPPIRYTADHTGTVCPECGPDCWDITPGAYERGRAFTESTKQAPKQATVAIPQSRLDAQARELYRERARLEAQVRRILEDDRITDDTRADYEWLLAETRTAGSVARLAELRDQMTDMPVRRRGGFLFSRWPDDYEPADVEDDGEVYDAVIVEEDDDAGAGTGSVLAEVIPLQPTYMGTNLCYFCYAEGETMPAVYRLNVAGWRGDGPLVCVAHEANPPAGLRRA